MHRRTRRTLVALAVAQILLGSSVLGYRWASTSTEVSSDEAVERFRAQSTDPSSATLPPGLPEGAIMTPTPEPTPSPTPSRRQARGATPSPPPPPATEPSFPQEPPEAGVYEWRTEGWEEAANVRRDFPENSRRSVTHKGPKTWENHHFYSQEHEERMDLTLTEQGVATSYYWAKVRFGPFNQEQTITFDPPIRLSVFPLSVGQQWQGDWSGDTSGTYAGRTFEHTTLRIGDEDVEVWGIQVDMTMRGEVNGTVTTKIWVSPKYRQTVKEFYDQEVTSGPGTYKGRWTITLRDPQPTR